MQELVFEAVIQLIYLGLSKGQALHFGEKLKSKSIFSSTVFFTCASVLARIGGFIVQIVLGWILVKEQYGLFAIALSIASIFHCMRNGGTDQIIIQRGKDYSNLAPRIASFSLMFNIIVCMLIIGSAGEIADYYEKPELDTLLIILALGYLFATPGPILIAQLSIHKKFHLVAIINLITILSKHGITILLAVLGLGVFSLLIPLAMQPLIGTVTVYLFVKNWPGFSGIHNIKIIELLRSSVWVIASNLAFQLSNNLQYFVLGVYFNTSILGIYFFAVQIINSPISLITNTVKGVVFPSLSNMLDDKNKYNKAVIKSIIIAYSIGAIIGLIGYIIFPLITNYVWQGKWDESIIFIEILCLMIPPIILINTVYEIFSSSGFWKGRFFLLTISIIVEGISIWLVINYADMIIIVMNLLLFRSIFSLFTCFFAFKIICGMFYFVDVVLIFIPFLLVSISLMLTKIYSYIEYNTLVVASFFILGILYYYLILNRYIMINRMIINILKRIY